VKLLTDFGPWIAQKCIWRPGSDRTRWGETPSRYKGEGGREGRKEKERVGNREEEEGEGKERRGGVGKDGEGKGKIGRRGPSEDAEGGERAKRA